MFKSSPKTPRPLVLIKFSPDGARDKPTIPPYHEQAFKKAGFDVKLITDDAVSDIPAAMALVNVAGQPNQDGVDKVVEAAHKQFPGAKKVFAYATFEQSKNYRGPDMASEGPQNLIAGKEIFEIVDRVKDQLGIEKKGWSL